MTNINPNMHLSLGDNDINRKISSGDEGILNINGERLAGKVALVAVQPDGKYLVSFKGKLNGKEVTYNLLLNDLQHKEQRSGNYATYNKEVSLVKDETVCFLNGYKDEKICLKIGEKVSLKHQNEEIKGKILFADKTSDGTAVLYIDKGQLGGLSLAVTKVYVKDGAVVKAEKDIMKKDVLPELAYNKMLTSDKLTAGQKKFLQDNKELCIAKLQNSFRADQSSRNEEELLNKAINSMQFHFQKIEETGAGIDKTLKQTAKAGGSQLVNRVLALEEKLVAGIKSGHLLKKDIDNVRAILIKEGAIKPEVAEELIRNAFAKAYNSMLGDKKAIEKLAQECGLNPADLKRETNVLEMIVNTGKAIKNGAQIGLNDDHAGQMLTTKVNIAGKDYYIRAENGRYMVYEKDKSGGYRQVIISDTEKALAIVFPTIYAAYKSIDLENFQDKATLEKFLISRGCTPETAGQIIAQADKKETVFIAKAAEELSKYDNTKLILNDDKNIIIEKRSDGLEKGLKNIEEKGVRRPYEVKQFFCSSPDMPEGYTVSLIGGLGKDGLYHYTDMSSGKVYSSKTKNRDEVWQDFINRTELLPPDTVVAYKNEAGELKKGITKNTVWLYAKNTGAFATAIAGGILCLVPGAQPVGGVLIMVSAVTVGTDVVIKRMVNKEYVSDSEIAFAAAGVIMAGASLKVMHSAAKAAKAAESASSTARATILTQHVTKVDELCMGVLKAGQYGFTAAAGYDIWEMVVEKDPEAGMLAIQHLMFSALAKGTMKYSEAVKLAKQYKIEIPAKKTKAGYELLKRGIEKRIKGSIEKYLSNEYQTKYSAVTGRDGKTIHVDQKLGGVKPREIAAKQQKIAEAVKGGKLSSVNENMFYFDKNGEIVIAKPSDYITSKSGKAVLKDGTEFIKNYKEAEFKGHMHPQGGKPSVADAIGSGKELVYDMKTGEMHVVKKASKLKHKAMGIEKDKSVRASNTVNIEDTTQRIDSQRLNLPLSSESRLIARSHFERIFESSGELQNINIVKLSPTDKIMYQNMFGLKDTPESQYLVRYSKKGNEYFSICNENQLYGEKGTKGLFVKATEIKDITSEKALKFKEDTYEILTINRKLIPPDENGFYAKITDLHNSLIKIEDTMLTFKTTIDSPNTARQYYSLVERFDLVIKEFAKTIEIYKNNKNLHSEFYENYFQVHQKRLQSGISKFGSSEKTQLSIDIFKDSTERNISNGLFRIFKKWNEIAYADL